MFETAILSYGNAPKRVWTTCMGVTGQALLVLTVVVIPMIRPQVLPHPQALLQVFLPTAPPAPPPAPPDIPRTAHVMPTHAFQMINGQVSLPRVVPPVAAQIEDPANAPAYRIVGGGGENIGVIGGLERFFSTVGVTPQVPAPARTAPAVAKPTPSEPLRYKQGGLVKPARLVHRIDPIYPQLAKTAHVSGTVELEGVIGVDGRLRELKVLRGHPLLVPSAVEAVRQWVYEPTTLNGDLVEVIAPITVNFRLSN